LAIFIINYQNNCSTTMKKLSLLLLISAVVFSCSKFEIEEGAINHDVLRIKENKVLVPEGDPLTKADVDRTVMALLEEKKDFHWEWVDLKTLWSAIQYGDQSVAIGYKPYDKGDISSELHELEIGTGEYRAVHDALIEKILEELEKSTGQPVEWKEILVEDDPILPVITVRMPDRNVLTMLHNLENVRYLEPLDYYPDVMSQSRSTSGCSASTEPLNSEDYSSVSPNALLPWNFNNHNVPQAWNIAQGSGITVAVIDAGLSSAQPLLGSDFNNGESNTGRTVEAEATYGSSPYSSCTHGNSMAAQAVGPKNDRGATTGVAYKSNLHFVRGCEDVVLDLSSERRAVKNACTKLGRDRDVDIISMSIGTPFASSTLKDGVDYAYGRGKLIMAAAGTSFSLTSWYGVVYPAYYSSCVAVTGVDESGSTCASCHDGGQVEYTIVMERDANSSRNSLTLPASGTTPDYIGGSSSATATAAGIAALVWSVNPNMSREEVLNCLATTSQYYPNGSFWHGYGNIDAYAAVLCASGGSDPCEGTGDSDGDGVCDALDICPGFDDSVDSDGDEIPDGCDDCNNAVVPFSADPLTDNGDPSPSSSTASTGGNSGISFTVSGIGAKTNGSPSRRYVDVVTITYTDGGGASHTYGVFDGSTMSGSSVDVTINEPVLDITVSLQNSLANNVPVSVNISDATYCAAGQ
jgi:hypothetical protein